MSSLYNRNLLSGFGAAEIESILESALAYVDQGIDLATEMFQDALKSRLEFRKGILRAVGNIDCDGSSEINPWTWCLETLPNIMETKELGVLTQHSFNAKIQRKLASNVPPRPVVETNFEDAFAYFQKICENGKDVYHAYDIIGSTNLMVCQFVRGGKSEELT